MPLAVDTPDMSERIAHALAAHTDDYRVGRRLHAVPPHRVHEVQFAGRRAVCKVGGAPADPVTEGRVVAFVDARTSVPVPELLAVGRDPDHAVYAWHDAAPVPDGGSLDRATARAMGRGLATLHVETDECFASSGHPRGRATEPGLALDGREAWSDTLLDRVAARHDWLAVADRSTDADVEAAEAVAAFVRDHREVYDAATREDGVALLHGTWLPDHVGVADGTVRCVLDFEHATVGPPAYDYLRTAVPVFGGEPDHGVPEDVFRAAYESVRPLPSGFEDHREAVLLVQMVSYLRALYVQDQHPDVTGQAARIRTSIQERLAALREQFE